MTEWVVVNGARIEKAYFEANVAEARSLSWTPSTWRQAGGHTHCLICGIALDADSGRCYESEGGWACVHCLDAYVVPRKT